MKLICLVSNLKYGHLGSRQNVPIAASYLNKKTPVADALGAVTRYHYNRRDQLVEEKNALGGIPKHNSIWVLYTQMDEASQKMRPRRCTGMKKQLNKAMLTRKTIWATCTLMGVAFRKTMPRQCSGIKKPLNKGIPMRKKIWTLWPKRVSA